ncbi:MAG TPA: NAD-dependent epimerase/dehydratase family protein [Pyrinomonadaceae bacterium]
MRLLITGSNGFLGGSVGRWAARAGHEVLGVARASQPGAGWPGAYVQADVLTSDLAGIVSAFAPDVLLHGAGTASVAASLQTPLDDLRAAVMTWANTLDAVRRAGLRPLILFPSSAAVYGNLTALPAREDAPVRPISPYGFHKAACELLAREYAECFGLNVLVCRLFSLFGAAQRRLLVWELYRQCAGADATIWLAGTGTETRDYLHVDDIAAAFIALATAKTQATDEARCLVINVASGAETSVLELARQVRALVAPEKEIRCHGLARPGDPHAWRADITALRALALDWQPQPLASALAQCIATWQQEANRE